MKASGRNRRRAEQLQIVGSHKWTAQISLWSLSGDGRQGLTRADGSYGRDNRTVIGAKDTRQLKRGEDVQDEQFSGRAVSPHHLLALGELRTRRRDPTILRHVADRSGGKPPSPLPNGHASFSSGRSIWRWIIWRVQSDGGKRSRVNRGDVTGEDPPILNLFVWARLKCIKTLVPRINE